MLINALCAIKRPNGGIAIYYLYPTKNSEEVSMGMFECAKSFLLYVKITSQSFSNAQKYCVASSKSGNSDTRDLIVTVSVSATILHVLQML